MLSCSEQSFGAIMDPCCRDAFEEVLAAAVAIVAGDQSASLDLERPLSALYGDDRWPKLLFEESSRSTTPLRRGRNVAFRNDVWFCLFLTYPQAGGCCPGLRSLAYSESKVDAADPGKI
jgi:hypothetical protein